MFDGRKQRCQRAERSGGKQKRGEMGWERPSGWLIRTPESESDAGDLDGRHGIAQATSHSPHKLLHRRELKPRPAAARRATALKLGPAPVPVRATGYCCPGEVTLLASPLGSLDC
jgi:hypothetical protein